MMIWRHSRGMSLHFDVSGVDGNDVDDRGVDAGGVDGGGVDAGSPFFFLGFVGAF